ncbi:MAG: glycoside hydrolase family 2 protein [Armatimonadota bacterium]
MIPQSTVVDLVLALSKPETVEFEEGGSTTLRPARWVCELADRAPLPLEGEWQVLYWPFAGEEQALAGASAGGDWQTIQQPGKVFYYDPEQRPSDIPNWNRVTMEHIDPDDGAIIKRSVTIPEEWRGQRVLLRFEGIYPAGRIYWDGQAVGEQWSGLTPIEIDVTELAAPGTTHTLAVRLYRRHPFVQMDMPRHALEFTGLCRPAFLHVVEPLHVAELVLRPELAEDYGTGALHGEMILNNLSGAAVDAGVAIQVRDAAGELVAAQFSKLQITAGAHTPVAIAIQVGQVQPWNAERPYLYTASVQVEAAGQQAQTISQRIGFRRFELKDQRPLLNGTPVKFRGVNHLTFSLDGGMETPEPWLRQCLTMMKRANVNAIRTHFFGPRELVDLCDEMGIYLLQELPIDWGHGYVYDPTTLGEMLHRMEACARRDRNHTSVMVWSIGNENMARNEEEYDLLMGHLRLCKAMVQRLDPTRPTMFPPPGPANKIRGVLEVTLGDISDIHYSFNLIRLLNETGEMKDVRTWTPTFEELTRDQLLERGWSGVWFSSEYGIMNLQADLLHAPYLSIINDVPEDALSGKNTQEAFYDRLVREWGYMRDDPTCLGGAYFPWVAAGAGDPWGWVRWGEDADWGVLTLDLQPKPAFWAMRILFSPVRLPERVTWEPGQTEITLTIDNGYNSIDLSECTLRTQMGGGPPYMGQMRDWRDIPMAGAPGTTATVRVPIWNPDTQRTLEAGKPVVCRCTVLDPTGYRPIMVDVIVTPHAAEPGGEAAMPVGPDAVL